MKYKFCEQLQKSVFFDRNSVSHCCNCDKERYTFFMQNYNGEYFDWQALIEKKKEIQELAKNNIVYFDACKYCHMWQEKDWEDITCLSEFVISHWTACNCNCFYCFTAEDKTFYNSFKNYNLLPVFKSFFNSDFFNKSDNENNMVRFLGGDISDLDNFEELINLFIQNNIQNFYIPTSGIKYLPIIETLLSEFNTEVIISLDCGSSDLYRKIKRTNAFEQVISNIKKYAKTANQKSNFILKYILIPYVNESKEEIDKFFDICLKSGVKHIAQDVEDNFMSAFSQTISVNTLQMLKYIHSKADQYGMKITNFRYATQLLYAIDNGLAKISQNDSCKKEQIQFTEKMLCR